MSSIELNTDIHSARLARAEKSSSDHILAALHKHYPGYRWGVDFSEDGSSTLRILNFSLSGKMSYLLYTDRMGSNYVKICVKAAGEILERYNQRRGLKNSADIAALVKDRKGENICQM